MKHNYVLFIIVINREEIINIVPKMLVYADQ